MSRPEGIDEDATAAVDAIFVDLRDRRFLKWLFSGRPTLITPLPDGDELRSLDADVQDEIRIAWHTIIARALQSERDRSASTITALREDVERLRHEVDSAGALRLRMEAHKQSAQAAEAPLTALRERAETAEREVERLREALAPFAHRADACNKVDRTYSTEDWTPGLLNDFRRARAALEASDA